MPDSPPTNPSGSELLTIREVANLLRIKPDTLYRWARSGRLSATKVGKEWRISLSDVEGFVGRSLPRTVEYDAAQDGEIAEPAEDGDASSRPTSAGVERRLRTFLRPRDHILALASKKGDLARIEQAFWRIAMNSGGTLLILHAPDQTKIVRKALKDLGVNTRVLRKEGRLNLVEVRGAKEARTALHLEASKGSTVWATYGMANSVQIPRDLALEHAHELDAACVTCNAIILNGWLVTRKNWAHSDAWRLEAAHRGLIRIVDGELLFARLE